MATHISALRTLAYVSKAAYDVGQDDLHRLFVRAADYNATVDVTGLLLFCDGVFLQTLEGVSDNVEAVLQRIKNDPMHRIDNIFVDEPTQERVYPAWAMMASLVPAEAALVSFLKARTEGAKVQLTKGQLLAVDRTLRFATQGLI